MKHRRYIIIGLGMALSMALGHAQTLSGGKVRHGLDAFRKQTRAEFEDFRKQAMSEFIGFVRNPWNDFEHTAPVPVPEEKPVPPVVMPLEDEQKPVEEKPVIIEQVVTPDPPQPQPQPIEPVVEVPVKVQKYVAFTFFGTCCRVRFDADMKLKLDGVGNNEVADALQMLACSDYDNMIIDCLALRDSLQLSDWAYIQMLRSLAYTIEGERTNAATLLMAYLYMQSGYKMRLAANDNRLYMLYASEHYIYDHVSYAISGETYYGIEQLPTRLAVCNVAFPKEKAMSLYINTCQKFTPVPSEKRKIVSKRYGGFGMETSVNMNLMDFYATYPTSFVGDDIMTRWAMYANTPVDATTSSLVYPQLRRQLDGLSQIEAVNRLLNMVQTGLEYEYDDKVWGMDRAFFAEESLYYPYCDCEDRSILLTRLVRDLLGLKCLLVYYPGHLASAVEFTEGDVKGDYIMHEGHRYLIADGTYINAPVGRTMPGMDNTAARIIVLD